MSIKTQIQSIERIKEQPKGITIVYLQAVLAPNGEIIHQGENIGYFKNCREFIYVEGE